jgi:hypothetical protein
MKNTLSPKAAFGIIGGVVVVAAIGLFIGLRDPNPVTKTATQGSARPAPPPTEGSMPEWAREKLHSAEAGSK